MSCARCCPSSRRAPASRASLELEPDPRLPEGAAQLLWPGGWLEHDPGRIGRTRRRRSWPPTVRRP